MLRDSVRANSSHRVVTLDRWLLGRKRKIGSIQSVIITVYKVVPIISLGINRPKSAVDLLGLGITCNLALVTDSEKINVRYVGRRRIVIPHSLYDLTVVKKR